MRLIVNFDSVGKNTVLTLYKAPALVAGMNMGRNVRIRPLAGANAQARGEELVKLLRRHEPVKQALAMALAQPPTAPPQPIYIRVVADAADALPWELLYAIPQGFVALDPRWPVGRIGTFVRDLTDRSFVAPFRTVAVLSAAARQGQAQLDALVRAVMDARQQGLTVHLHVITGEQAVIDRAHALNVGHITAEWIAASPVDVGRQITDARPSILHLLCHGGFAAPGVRGLALATMQDFLAGEQTGSVVLSLDMLARTLEPADPWLVVLAACETAQATDSAAFAHGLVNAGIPTVIGMRRLVDLGAMNHFCSALYPEIFATVTRVLKPDPGRPPVRTIDWVTALTAPRQKAIVGINPAQVDTWSDPVLYAQEAPLRVYVPPDEGLSAEEYAALRARFDLFVLFRQRLDPVTTPAAVLAEADGEIARLQALLPGEPDD
jgi:CHAT domain